MIRLSAYELRKLFDTRSSAITMAVCVAVATVLGILGLLVQSEGVVDLSQTSAVTVVPFAVIAPVLAVIAGASDWRSRWIQQSLFSEPRRGRIFIAKLLATLVSVSVLSCVAIGLAIAAGAIVALSRNQPTEWGNFTEMLWGVMALVIPGALFGFAIGTLVMAPGPAIALVLVVELVIDVALLVLPDGLGAFFTSSALPNWVASGEKPLPAVTSALIWVVVPGIVGYLRYLRTEAG